ncbi:MAG: diguanylate cyclase domain-containing protein, partial [Gammaproteobacteria bacterium]
MFDAFRNLLGEAHQSGEELSCIMADIDQFKAVNDRYGHVAGDQVITAFGKLLLDTVRSMDLVGRYGGEEFLVLLPGLGLVQAAAVAERARVKILEGPCDELPNALRFTASFGVSSSAYGALDPNELASQADKCLYLAKKSGRNRVVSWTKAAENRSATHREPAERVSNDRFIPVPMDIGLADPPPGFPVPIDTDRGAETETGGRLRRRIVKLEHALAVRERESDHLLSADTETSLSSQTLLYDRLSRACSRARRDNGNIAVFALNIDCLERVKIALGNLAGEKLIKAIAERITANLRASDSVTVIDNRVAGALISRLGSDEFVIVLTDLKPIDAIPWIANRLSRSLTEPLAIEGHEIYANPSVGVSVFPVDGEDGHTLVGNATAALHDISGKDPDSRCHFYSSEINMRAKHQLRLEGELRAAIERGE